MNSEDVSDISFDPCISCIPRFLSAIDLQMNVMKVASYKTIIQ